jgi:hypothetical protein
MMDGGQAALDAYVIGVYSKDEGADPFRLAA